MIITLLRNRGFLALWLAQIAATLGNELYNIGVMVAIYERTGSALQATGVLFARMLPGFLFGPLAGALVDRYDRRWVLISMNLLRAALIAIVVLTTSGVVSNVWLVYLIVFGIALADIFYKPAQMALIPSLVPRSVLISANSLAMSTNLAAYALAYGAGGWILIQFGISTLIGINLGCFLFAALAACYIQRLQVESDGEQTKATTPILRMIGDGLHYLRHHELARSLVVMETLEYWPHGIWTASIMLVFAEQALQATPQAWGNQLAVFWGSNAVGAILALLLANRLAKRPGHMIILNAFMNGLLTVAYALSPNVLFALIICAAYGLPSAFRDVAQDTLLQASVDQRLLGRVYATRQMLGNISFLGASLILAWMADHTPVRWVYLLGSGLYLLTALYALNQRALRTATLDKPVIAASQPDPVLGA